MNQYIVPESELRKVFLKPVILRAKFGKGRKSSIKEWRFETRKRAETFAKFFLKHNHKCTTYMIME